MQFKAVSGEDWQLDFIQIPEKDTNIVKCLLSFSQGGQRTILPLEIPEQVVEALLKGIIPHFELPKSPKVTIGLFCFNKPRGFTGFPRKDFWRLPSGRR